MRSFALFTSVALLSPALGKVLSNKTPQFSEATLAKVQSNLAVIATHSWEIGTGETALFELNAPHAFVYEGTIPPKLVPGDNVTEIWESVDAVLAQKPAGILPFFSDGAAGDPASVGIPFLIRAVTQKPPVNSYSIAAGQELEYLVDVVPRTPDGAISHRSPPEAVQLWADNLSMAPPFIAYYGALYHNKSLLDLAYTQVKVYRKYLLDNTSLLEHIVLGETDDRDSGHWSTGNGWFLSGMLRVLRILQLSSFLIQTQSEQQDILNWATDLTTAIWNLQQPDGSLLNYLDQPAAGSNGVSFPESSGTALIAAATFRLAALTRGRFDSQTVAWRSRSVPAADRARQYIVGQVDSDGWLNGVVNPLNWRQAAPSGVHSPEGQAFVLMLQAAYRDWWKATGGAY